MSHFMLFYLVLSMLCIVTVANDGRCAESPENVVSAKSMFAEGESLFDEGAYLAAAAAFQRAYELAPHPSTLVNIGYCYEFAKEYVRAISIYDEYLQTPLEKSSKTAEKIRNRLAMLKLLVGEMHVFCDPVDCIVEIDGVVKGDTADGEMVIMMAPGTYTVTVRGDNEQIVNREYRVEAGQKTNARFTVKKNTEDMAPLLPEAENTIVAEPMPTEIADTHPHDEVPREKGTPLKLKIGFFTLFGATLAGCMLTSYFGVQTLKSKSEYEDSGYTDARARDDTIHNKRMTNVFVGATALLAAGALSLRLILVRRQDRYPQRKLSLSIDVGNTVGVLGRF